LRNRGYDLLQELVEKQTMGKATEEEDWWHFEVRQED